MCRLSFFGLAQQGFPRHSTWTGKFLVQATRLEFIYSTGQSAPQSDHDGWTPGKYEKCTTDGKMLPCKFKFCLIHSETWDPIRQRSEISSGRRHDHNERYLFGVSTACWWADFHVNLGPFELALQGSRSTQAQTLPLYRATWKFIPVSRWVGSLQLEVG